MDEIRSQADAIRDFMEAAWRIRQRLGVSELAISERQQLFNELLIIGVTRNAASHICGG